MKLCAKNPKAEWNLDKKFPMFTVGNRSFIYSLTDDGPDEGKEDSDVLFFSCLDFVFSVYAVSATNLFIKDELSTVFQKKS